MSEIMKSFSKPRDSQVNSTVQTKFWGLTCEAGLKYNQRVKKKYCLTKVVLDPESCKKEDTSKTVSVVVKHDDGESIIAVLKHGEKYESDLNLVFDRENVTFYLKGNGTVNIVGYEVVEPEENSSENSVYLPKGGKAKMKTGSPSDAEKLGKSLLKSERKAVKEDDEEDEEESPAEYMNLLGDDLENSSDEEDEDFSLGDEMMNDEDDEDDDEDVDEDEEDEDLELDSDEESDDYDIEDINKPGPSTPQKKRKKLNAEKQQKRPKIDDSSRLSTSKANHSVSQSDSSGEESIQEIPVQSKKKGKKLKKKAQEMNNVPETMDKTPNGKNKATLQSRTLEGGVEVTDIKVGHGPEARKGKFLHVFYVGRLPNKEIFDAVLPGKKPFGFRLGKQEVIKGWEVGLEGMKVGGKRRIKVPPHMGYGKKSIEKIPPNSTLFFVVDLQHVS